MRLASHIVKVRIVDNVARTEIEGVFENGADEVLDVDRDYDRDKDVWTSAVRIDVGADGNPANDVTQTFDKVIFTIPLNRVPNLLDETAAERALFQKVDTDRYFVSLFTSPDLTRGQTVFVPSAARRVYYSESPGLTARLRATGRVALGPGTRDFTHDFVTTLPRWPATT